VIDEHRLGIVAAARPWLQLDGAEVGYILRADDVEILAAHEAQIGRVLLGLEFLRELVRNHCVLGHEVLPGANVSRG
jgi:hypothetical protein